MAQFNVEVIATLVVAAGGAIGAVLRWIALRLGKKHFPGVPVPTFLINCIGSFGLGWLAAGDASLLTLGFGTGLLGGFTTFSTFALESVQLVEDPGKRFSAIIYIIGTLFASAALAGAGWLLRTISYT